MGFSLFVFLKMNSEQDYECPICFKQPLKVVVLAGGIEYCHYDCRDCNIEYIVDDKGEIRYVVNENVYYSLDQVKKALSLKTFW